MLHDIQYDWVAQLLIPTVVCLFVLAMLVMLEEADNIRDARQAAHEQQQEERNGVERE